VSSELDRVLPHDSLKVRHKVLNTIAFALMTVSAVLARARRNARWGTPRLIMIGHGALNACAALLISGAGWIAYSAKEQNSRPHLTSLHSWWGAAAGAIVVLLSSLSAMGTLTRPVFPYHDDSHALGGLIAHGLTTAAVRRECKSPLVGLACGH
jgi:hypothetical protein